MTSIDSIRSGFLNRCEQNSHGIGSLFEENYRAADNLLRGFNQTGERKGELIMRSGHNARRYAENRSKHMQNRVPGIKTAEDWASWILGENRRIIMLVDQVEERYQELADSAFVAPLTDKQIEDFQAFCDQLL